MKIDKSDEEFTPMIEESSSANERCVCKDRNILLCIKDNIEEDDSFFDIFDLKFEFCDCKKCQSFFNFLSESFVISDIEDSLVMGEEYVVKIDFYCFKTDCGLESDYSISIMRKNK